MDRYLIFCKEEAAREEFSSQNFFSVDMASSFQGRILILSREVGYSFLIWMNSAESHENYFRKFGKQVIIKLFLTYSVRKIFIICQNLKHVHVKYSFHELLVFFWLALVDIRFSLENYTNVYTTFFDLVLTS